MNTQRDEEIANHEKDLERALAHQDGKGYFLALEALGRSPIDLRLYQQGLAVVRAEREPERTRIRRELQEACPPIQTDLEDDEPESAWGAIGYSVKRR